MKYSLFFQINGYNHFIFCHACSDDVGASFADRIVTYIIEDVFSKFLPADQKIFKMTFDKKKTLREVSSVSLILTVDNSIMKDGAQSMCDEITNILFTKIIKS